MPDTLGRVQGRRDSILNFLLFATPCDLPAKSAQGKTDAARDSAEALLKAAQSLPKAGWTFGGTKHFVAAHPAFSAAKDAWVKLFESLETGDGPGLAEAVRTIQGTLKN